MPPAKPNNPIAFIDLQAQRRRIGPKLNDAVIAAIESGAYIMGPPVKELESKLANFGQAKHCLTCANGTEALVLPLMAWEVGPGDAVFCPSFTFAATAEIVPLVGASCVFVDVDGDTFNMSPSHLEATIKATLREGTLKPKVVIAVCLFGQPANYPALREICDRYGLKLIADSAQGFGGTLKGKHPTYWADCTTTSFFPAKPLGAYGDGGAVLTDDDLLAEQLVSLRMHGQAGPRDVQNANFSHEAKYLNVRIGMNSRLDTVQAAVLLEKLAIFPDELAARDAVAARYGAGLSNAVSTPRLMTEATSSWAQYTIKTDRRDDLAAHLKSMGVPAMVYYPIAIHKQIPYAKYPLGPGGLPVTESLTQKVLSLPMHPYLEPDVQDYIIHAVNSFGGD
ncbi:MAG: DegT/DnrJ/EryC1/StrS aminotransferase family protein [Caulobacteraceae bacterium]|nr:DegT/DnrJ/EryC1/StrS aminotransferase family protein [Caulobacteraceae bacterium]